jgi:hypothetical protein
MLRKIVERAAVGGLALTLVVGGPARTGTDEVLQEQPHTEVELRWPLDIGRFSIVTGVTSSSIHVTSSGNVVWVSSLNSLIFLPFSGSTVSLRTL